MTPRYPSRSFAAQFAHLLRQRFLGRFHFGWLVLLFALTFSTTQLVSLVSAWASKSSPRPAAEKPAT